MVIASKEESEEEKNFDEELCYEVRR